MSSDQKYLEKFEIKVGKKTYIFKNMELTKNAIGKWGLSFETTLRMMRSVAGQILADLDLQLSFHELEFLAKVANMSMAKIAEMLGMSRSTLTKWKNGETTIAISDSYYLKSKLAKIIFEDIEIRKDSPESRLQFWTKNANLPAPEESRVA